MTLELTLDEIIQLAHCAHKMNALAERSPVIAEALGIDRAGRAKLDRITKKLKSSVEKYIRQ